jgi:hypothetical protein
MVHIMVFLALDFFHEVGFIRENFIFFEGLASSTGSLGGVTSP